MRKIYVTFFCLSASCLTATKSYSEDVDYLSYQDRVNLFTELAVSAKSCESAGMKVNWEDIKKIPDQLIADAIRSGIDVDTFAEPLIVNSIREKRENEDFLVKHYQENPDKMDEFAEHWAKRCHKLATHKLTKKYIQLKK